MGFGIQVGTENPKIEAKNPKIETGYPKIETGNPKIKTAKNENTRKRAYAGAKVFGTLVEPPNNVP